MKSELPILRFTDQKQKQCPFLSLLLGSQRYKYASTHL
jgi:hypothetical protein